MRRCLICIALVGTVAVAAPVSAQDDGGDAETYEFDAKKFESDQKAREHKDDDGAGDAEFDNVREIDKKSFFGGGDSESSDSDE